MLKRILLLSFLCVAVFFLISLMVYCESDKPPIVVRSAQVVPYIVSKPIEPCNLSCKTHDIDIKTLISKPNVEYLYSNRALTDANGVVLCDKVYYRAAFTSFRLHESAG
ncbi:MAG: hypothetical protein GX337_06375 [Christensenellaceae bacterium]|nr:hypothetical protein [Christensenellaceae bacterium]